MTGKRVRHGVDADLVSAVIYLTSGINNIRHALRAKEAGADDFTKYLDELDSDFDKILDLIEKLLENDV